MVELMEEREDLFKKFIAFDLDQAALKEYYPRPRLNLNPQYHKKAYQDMRKFMEQNGFEHRQGSAYISKEPMGMIDVISLMQNLSVKLPWFGSCVSQIDVADIRERQFGLKGFLNVTSLDMNRDSVGFEPIVPPKKGPEAYEKKPSLDNLIINADEKRASSVINKAVAKVKDFEIG